MTGEILITMDAPGVAGVRRADKNPFQLRALETRKNEILKHPQVDGKQTFMQIREKQFYAGNFFVLTVYHIA